MNTEEGLQEGKKKEMNGEILFRPFPTTWSLEHRSHIYTLSTSQNFLLKIMNSLEKGLRILAFGSPPSKSASLLQECPIYRPMSYNILTHKKFFLLGINLCQGFISSPLRKIVNMKKRKKPKEL